MGRWAKIGYSACLAFLALASGCDQPLRAGRTAGGSTDRSSVVIRCDAQCDAAAAAVSQNGGIVSRRYRALGLISASLPNSTLSTVSVLVGSQSIFKDSLIAAPEPVNEISSSDPRATQTYKLARSTLLGVSTVSSTSIPALANVSPTDFSFDTILTGAADVHRSGQLGKDVITAIIDSGTANNAEIVPVLAGSVIGGETFLNDPNEPSATSTLNDPHGTMVGTMIAGHGVIHLNQSHELVQSLLVHAPQAIRTKDGIASMAMVGTAPATKIYAMKTFPANGDGTASSVVLAALDRALTLKTNFDAGVPSGPVSGAGTEDSPFVYDSLNIRVINLSLGGPTLFSGREIDELMIRKLYDAGITVVVAAGNEGFGAITTGSPATAPGAISVGAASLAPHERVLRDLQKGPGVGIQFRPTDRPQVARFSSRGPTADGRVGIDLVASGHAVFVQGADGEIGLVSGTSFSAPTVAGAAALLIGAVPTATASAIRGALIESANPRLIGPTAREVDQGHGFLDVTAALKLLKTGDPTAHLPLEPIAAADTLVVNNVRAAGFPPVAFTNGQFNATVRLAPGEVKQFFVSTFESTEHVVVTVTKITPSLPKPQQNALFGDDLGIIVLNAPTATNATEVEDFIGADSTYKIDRPQPGLMRVAVMGDWTNVGSLSATISITRTQSPSTFSGIAGTVSDQSAAEFEFVVPEGTTGADIALSWAKNWSFYPAHDLDLVLVAPDETVIVDGATLDSPERVHLDNPLPGVWKAVIEGFMLHEYQDRFQLRVTDGTGAALQIKPAPVTALP